MNFTSLVGCGIVLLTHLPGSTYDQDEEQSWFYYLSEIALRRIENRILRFFYHDDNGSWDHSDIHSMVAIVGNIEVELQNW